MTHVLRTVTVSGVLSVKSQYGVVWKGVLGDVEVAVKMVLLQSGIHYDKKLDELVDGAGRVVSKVRYQHPVCEFFGLPPTTFDKRKSLTRGQFEWEVRHMRRLAKLDLSPHVYDSWYETDGPFHFAFLVTGLCHANGKAILLQRDYSKRELHLLKNMVEKLHGHRYFHGDLKPSNMGVYLNDNGAIVKFHLLDCNKTKRVKGNFWPLKRHDYGTFKKHFAKNLKARGR